MQLDQSLIPAELDRPLAEAIANAAQQADNVDLGYLHNRIHAHLRRARLVAQASPVVHITLAEALVETYDALMARWGSFPNAAQPWLKGAMLYFFEVDDDDHDFDSPMGFDDDLAVLNACLRIAGLDELCLNPKDFEPPMSSSLGS